jgi:nitrite reductase/ring-hydroxylating ferredoxin subunit/uncharacterized membrane protein
MRSKASIKSHPLHPILVSFPIAFLTGTFVIDLVSTFLGDASLWQMGYYLEIAGIATGLLAAVPGAIDYFYTVPPKSSAKERGTKHALLNVTHLILFFIAWMIRSNESPNTTLVLILEAVGVILISIAGWLGGTLVYRNQIAVDPRYAEAGKWKEEYIDATTDKIKVATADELKLNQMKLLHVGKKRIVIGKTEKGYVAFDDRCTHKGGSLAGGAMICGTVQCPWHGSHFDVETGKVKAGPAKESIPVYPVTQSDGNIYLQLS